MLIISKETFRFIIPIYYILLKAIQKELYWDGTTEQMEKRSGSNAIITQIMEPLLCIKI